MIFKQTYSAAVALCIAVSLLLTLCSCDDLGAYEDEEDYYDSFGEIVLINGETKESESYSVEEYFYNRESRNDFLEEDDGSYAGVPEGKYLYMAIPVQRDVEMDTLALYMKGIGEGVVYMSVFLSDEIPEKPRGIGDPESELVEENGEMVEKKIEYDDPDPETSLGEISIYLSEDEWSSFMMDSFTVEGNVSGNVFVTAGQYILIQFRNNSGIRTFDENTGSNVDEPTGLVLEETEFTATNLLLRALQVGSKNQ